YCDDVFRAVRSEGAMSGTVSVMAGSDGRRRYRSGTLVLHRESATRVGLPSTHGTRAAIGAAGLRDLPCRNPWRRKDSDLSRRRRPAVLPRPLRVRSREVRLALLRVLPDDEPLPP